MTNYEKYKDEIDMVWENGDIASFTKDNGVDSCQYTSCCDCLFSDDMNCSSNVQKWLVSEYKDPAETEDVDWSKVSVNTPVLVKHHENDSWTKAYFAKVDRDEVCTFKNGTTSWTNEEETFGGEKGRWLDMWKYAKLANPDDLKNSEFHQ